MNPISANISAIRNFMTINTRASRSEYWWVVATFIGGIVVSVFTSKALFPYGGGGSSLYSWLKFAYILFVLIWGLALISLSVRRLHDSDKSGLWMLLFLFAGPLGFLVVPILCLQPGTQGPNRFGPKPRIS